jgi:hypothetical protein
MMGYAEKMSREIGKWKENRVNSWLLRVVSNEVKVRKRQTFTSCTFCDFIIGGSSEVNGCHHRSRLAVNGIGQHDAEQN